MFAVIQVAYVFFQKLNEQTFLTVEICWDCFTKISFNWWHSFFGILVWQRLIHLVFSCISLFHKFTCHHSVMWWWNKLFLICIRSGFFILRWIIIFLNLLRQQNMNPFILFSNSFCILEMWLFFRYLFLTSIFLVQFIPLSDLFILLLSCLNTITLGTSRTLVLRTILLQFELLFDVVQILLIHLGENIIRFLLFWSQQFRWHAFGFRLRAFPHLFFNSFLLA